MILYPTLPPSLRIPVAPDPPSCSIVPTPPCMCWEGPTPRAGPYCSCPAQPRPACKPCPRSPPHPPPRPAPLVPLTRWMLCTLAWRCTPARSPTCPPPATFGACSLATRGNASLLLAPARLAALFHVGLRGSADAALAASRDPSILVAPLPGRRGRAWGAGKGLGLQPGGSLLFPALSAMPRAVRPPSAPGARLQS